MAEQQWREAPDREADISATAADGGEPAAPAIPRQSRSQLDRLLGAGAPAFAGAQPSSTAAPQGAQAPFLVSPEARTEKPRPVVHEAGTRPLNILMLEDVPNDVALIERQLLKAGMAFVGKRVETRDEFVEALETFSPDVVLCDYTLADFSGLEALQHVRDTHPEVPVVMMSGPLGEEAAIDLLKAGAKDFVLKHNLVRLPSSIERAILVEQGIRSRKAAEAALHQSESQFRGLVEQNVAGILFVRPDATIGYVNPYFAELHGYTQAEAIDQPIYGFLPDAERPRVREQLDRLLSGQPASVQFTTAMLARDGRTTDLLVHASRSIYEGKPAAIVVVVDITEHKRAQEQLWEEEKKFRSLVEQNVAAIAIVRADLTFGYVNPYFARLSGYAPAELIGRPLLDLVPERERSAVAKRLRSHFGEQASLVQMAWGMQRKDGRRVELFVNASPTVFDGSPASLAVIIDVSERRRTQRALRQSQQLLEGILNAIPVRVFWKDENLVYLGCNAPFAKDAGFADPRELVGKDDYQTAWRDHADAYRSDDREVIDTGRAKLLIEEQLTTPTAETLTILTNKIPLLGPDGRIAGVLGTYQDITERRHAVENLRASEERFRLVIEHAPDAVLLHDFDRERFVVANRAAETLFACGRDEILKYGPQHFYPPEQPDRQPVEQSFAEHTQRALAGERVTFERVIRNALGQERLCRVTLARLPSEEQRLLRASYVDVTDERRAQRELAEQAALLATEHELSPDGILVVDPAAKIISVNRRFGEIFKIPPELMVAKDDRPVLDWATHQMADQEGFLSRVRYLYEHPEESSRDEITLADGRVIDRYSRPVRQADGGYLGRVWFFRDITDKIESKRSLQRLNRALLTLSRGNEIVVHAATEQDLLEQMCRSIVETGGYRMAWVGAVDHAAKNILKTVASAGTGFKYLEKSHRVSWGEGEPGCRLCGGAIRTGEPQTSQNLLAEPLLAAWHRELEEHDFAAAAVFPLRQGEDVFAVLSIYAAETDAFNSDEMKLLGELADDLAYAIRALRERTAGEALSERWHRSLEATIGAIASTVEMRDEYTAGHQQRTAQLAVAIARDLQLPDHQVQGLHLAGIIHDVGKINIPAEILARPGRLSQLQYQLIQAHVEVGYEIVKGIDFPWPIAEMVRQHHERLDGSGYPRGLRGEEILPEARILAVADVVEAMMSHRPYRPALGVEAALGEIARGRGTAYDAAAVDACIALFHDKGFAFD